MRTVHVSFVWPLLGLVAGCSATMPTTPATPELARPTPSASTEVPAWVPPDEHSAGTVPETPMTLPPVATATPDVPPAPAPDGLEAVDWPNHPHAVPCTGAVADEPVFGDLDADGRNEAAVALRCPEDEASLVLVYGGDATEVQVLGNALPPEEHATVHAVQVRDARLVVSGLTSSKGAGGERDLAVTSRWVREGTALRRTDRWLDPAFVLEVDADH